MVNLSTKSSFNHDHRYDIHHSATHTIYCFGSFMPARSLQKPCFFFGKKEASTGFVSNRTILMQESTKDKSFTKAHVIQRKRLVVNFAEYDITILLHEKG